MPENRPLKGSRILIAEDNAIQALDLKMSLQDAGAEVIGPARSGPEALALAESASLTCAILDVVLRHELVFGAAWLLKRRGIKIVFHTGSSDIQALRRDWPEAQIVTKPAPPELLLKAVYTACACKAQRTKFA
jgi:CheY-like chemotaxis protein